MPKPSSRQNLYCYVDETGQDTEGQLFFVAVVIIGQDRDHLRKQLALIEESSGKRTRKWTRASGRQREAFMRSILSSTAFVGKLFYSKYPETRAYVDLTILSTAKAIQTYAPEFYTATVFVDGLHRTEQRRFASGLRQLRVKIRKVRGLNDQSDLFIRLADSLVGFVRDSHAGGERLSELYKQAIASKRVREV